MALARRSRKAARRRRERGLKLESLEPRLALATGLLSTLVSVVRSDNSHSLLAPGATAGVTEGTELAANVRLTRRPDSAITVTFKSLTPLEVGVPSTPLRFTRANWNQPQVVSFASLQDGSRDGDHRVPLAMKTVVARNPHKQATKKIWIESLDSGVIKPATPATDTYKGSIVAGSYGGGIQGMYDSVLNRGTLALKVTFPQLANFRNRTITVDYSVGADNRVQVETVVGVAASQFRLDATYRAFNADRGLFGTFTVLQPKLGRSATATLTAAAVPADTFGTGSNAFSIAFVDVGNAGNPADAASRDQLGAVPYVYRISTYEISQEQIALATAGGLQGVTAGAWGGSQPAAFMKWYEMAAFVNWLNTSTGNVPAYNLAYKGGSDNSSWVMSLWSSEDAWQNGGQNLYRNKNAYYFLPSDDEWFKAAYQKNDGVTGNYWTYPTGSDSVPTPVASGTAAGSAVFAQSLTAFPAPVKQSGGLSAYGTMGQGGNVWEWLETSASGSNSIPSEDRVMWGGSSEDQSQVLQSKNTSPFNANPAFENIYVGFRVASAEVGVGNG